MENWVESLKFCSCTLKDWGFKAVVPKNDGSQHLLFNTCLWGYIFHGISNLILSDSPLLQLELCDWGFLKLNMIALRLTKLIAIMIQIEKKFNNDWIFITFIFFDFGNQEKVKVYEFLKKFS